MSRSSSLLAPAIFGLAFGGTLLGCFGCSSPGGSGATDAGNADAQADAGSPVDAGPPPWADASLDKDTGATLPHPSFQPWGPEWGVLPGMPETAAVRYALDPKRAVSPVTWKPCVDGRSGCLEQVVDWTDLERGASQYRLNANVWNINGRPILLNSRVADQPERDGYMSSATIVADPRTGGVLFATASAPVFASSFHSSLRVEPGPNGLCVSALTSGFRTPEVEQPWERHWDYAQPLALNGQPAGAPQPKRSAVRGCPLPSVGGTGDLSIITFGGALYFTPFGADASTEVTFLDGTPVGGETAWPAHGGMTVWYSGGGGGLYFVDARGEWRWLILPLASATFGRATHDVTTDQLVWTEYDDEEPHTLRLYTAPWSLENASESRTLIASWQDRTFRFPEGSDLAAHDGLAVSISGLGEATVIDLVTKRRVILRASPGETFKYSVWANAGEVWLTTNPAAPAMTDSSARDGSAQTLKRFDVRPLFAAAP